MIDIDDLLDPIPITIGNHTWNGIPSGRRSIYDRRTIAGIKEAVITTVVGGVVGSLWAFAEVVDSPIKTVYKNVNHKSVTGCGISHIEHRFAHPLIANHGAAASLATVTMDPRIVISGA